MVKQWLSCLAVLAVALTAAHASGRLEDELTAFDSSCCPDDTEFNEGHCLSEEHGAESIHLECEHGAYLYESDELKDFFVTTDGTLITKNDDRDMKLEYGR